VFSYKLLNSFADLLGVGGDVKDVGFVFGGDIDGATSPIDRDNILEWNRVFQLVSEQLGFVANEIVRQVL